LLDLEWRQIQDWLDALKRLSSIRRAAMKR